MNLKAKRLDANLTMKQVGLASGIAESTYSLIEAGKRRPSPEVAQRLGKLLGFDWTLFYKDETATTDEAAGQ